MSDWQPIETAPRDGERILLFAPAWHISADHPVHNAMTVDARVGEGLFWDGEWRWANNSCDCCWYEMRVAPTHWMPLPGAPE